MIFAVVWIVFTFLLFLVGWLFLEVWSLNRRFGKLLGIVESINEQAVFKEDSKRDRTNTAGRN